ncbi:phosphoglucomutase [Bordetella pertussis]|nr:phosphoglucomutase [Bordetella pertussis]
MEGGVDTLDIGQVPTPLVYFAAHIQGTGSGVAVTGSHNPPHGANAASSMSSPPISSASCPT